MHKDMFKRDYFFLSNYYRCKVPYFGEIWNHAEGAFQAAKLLMREDRKRFLFLTPSEAVCEGRALKIRDDWDWVKNTVLFQILLSKFCFNPDLLQKLLATENMELDGEQGWSEIEGVSLSKHLMLIRYLFLGRMWA
jgi:hypothetical protein